MKELRCDTLVVGGGLSGLLIAHRAGGNVVLTTRGLGATALSSAAFRREPCLFNEFAELAESCGVEYAHGMVATESGDVVKAYAPRWCLLNSDAPFFVGLSGLPDAGWQPRALVNINWELPYPTWSNAAARLERVQALREILARSLAAVPATELLLPPVLGVSPGTRENIERAAGRRLVEISSSGGALGNRLLGALWGGLLDKEGVTALDEAKVVSLEFGSPHRANLSLGKLGHRSVDILADSVVLCTGGPLSSLSLDGDSLLEPLTGITCGSVSAPPPDFYGPQPAFVAHLPVDSRYRVDGLDGVYAAGALGAGFGLVECVDSALEVSRWL